MEEDTIREAVFGDEGTAIAKCDQETIIIILYESILPETAKAGYLTSSSDSETQLLCLDLECIEEI